MINSIDLKANKDEDIRAGLTAMDQVYGPTDSGFKLQAIDNSGAGRRQPWETPPGWVIDLSLEAPNLGGKVVLYTNEQTRKIMVVSMGTNGNEDVKGWSANTIDFGRSQLRAKMPSGNTLQEDVQIRLNELMERGYRGGILFAGDSKGAAQAQFFVHDIVVDRDKGELTDKLPYLAGLQNKQIGIIAHNGPGVEAVLKIEDRNFDPKGPQYDGIQAIYIVSKMQNSDTKELVSQTGGAYLANDGLVYQNELGVGIDREQVSKNANDYVYLHRHSQSLYDGMYARNGDFSALPTVPRTLMSINELAAVGGVFASIGQGDMVGTTEAKARIGSGMICGAVLSPISGTVGAMKGEFGVQTVLGFGFLTLWATSGVPLILAGACGIAVAGANGAKYLGGKDSSIVLSNTDLQSAINNVNAPSEPPVDHMRVFGYTKEGGVYVAVYLTKWMQI